MKQLRFHLWDKQRYLIVTMLIFIAISIGMLIGGFCIVMALPEKQIIGYIMITMIFPLLLLTVYSPQIRSYTKLFDYDMLVSFFSYHLELTFKNRKVSLPYDDILSVKQYSQYRISANGTKGFEVQITNWERYVCGYALKIETIGNTIRLYTSVSTNNSQLEYSELTVLIEELKTHKNNIKIIYLS